MISTKLSVLLILFTFYFQSSETATTQFNTKPSTPSPAVEGQNLTLVWTYTLDGTLGLAQFFNSTGFGTELIGKTFDPGNMTVESKYKERFRGQATNTRAELTILTVQRSDQGTYRANLVPSGSGFLLHDVKVIVQFPAKITDISGNQTVLEGTGLQLNCSATGEPNPNITWTRLSDNSSVNMPMMKIRRHDAGGYRCNANNNIGSSSSKDIFINVQYPPNITFISLNQTVAEGHVVLLNCTADGYPGPNITWTRLSTNRIVSMPLTITGKQDEGAYRCTADNRIKNSATSDVFLTVQYPPNITSISLNQTVAEGDVVLLNCTADGNPEPSITWTRLSGNSIVSMPMTIAGKQDEGGYRCTADNRIGSSNATVVFITVQFYRPINTDLSTNLTTNTVVLNETFNLLCHADANPPAKYRLYRDQSSLTNIARGQSNGTYLASVGNRVRLVTYKCVPFNTFGDGPAKTTNITVYYNPTTVSLVANTTENKNCSDFLLVNFTCGASEANPPVENYQLLKNQEILATSSKWTWVKNISEKGNHMYSCRALHPLGNVTSFDVRLTINVPVQISVHVIRGGETLTQGGNLTLSCNASGYPEPTVTWSKLNADELITSSLWLNFTNINKEATGEYVCYSNNTCGKKRSTVRTIDVQYKPENVSLTTSSLNVCIGKTVILMCSASDSNPAVDNFKLYKYGIELVDMVRANVGIFNQTLDSQGQHNYSCEARNSIGNTSSSNIILEVEVPASVIVMNRTMVVNEGDNVTLHCISSGFPRPNVSWVNASNYIVETGSILKLTNIGRHIRGFNCSASNACGNESRKVDIDVQYKPENVSLSTSSQKVCIGKTVILMCSAGDSNPAVEHFKLYKNGIALINMVGAKRGVFNQTLYSQGQHNYSCEASNSIGNASSSNIILEVEVPASVIVMNRTMVVNEGDNVTLHCISSGFPRPNVSWVNASNYIVETGNILNLTNIGRHIRGFNCSASNACGNESRKVNIDVQYKPENVSLSTSSYKVCTGKTVIIMCSAGDSNPAVEHFKLYKNGIALINMVGAKRGVFNQTLYSQGQHNYSCEASNSIGNASSSNIILEVEVPASVIVMNRTMVVNEGDNVTLHCISSGFPRPNVSWVNASNYIVETGNILNLTNIGRHIRGFNCSASNACGNESRKVNIDVQYKPENVSLSTSSYKVCTGKTVIIMCSAGDSNPAVEHFKLYKNGIALINMVGAKRGVFNQTLYSRGQHNYSCEASNSVGNASSSNTILEVEFPASVTVENRTVVVKEGDNVTLHCISSGFPRPSVSWVNASNYIVETGSILNLTNISRHIPGFNCSASNACGNDSRKVEIDVQYAAEAGMRGRNYSVSEGGIKLFSCLVHGNPEPNITWYKGSKAGGTVISIAKQLEARETGCYTCSASNSLGTPVTITQCLIMAASPLSTRTLQTSPTERMEIIKQITLTITNMDCNDFSEEEFRKEVKETLQPFELNSVEMETRCGSVVVYLTVRFLRSVGGNEVISALVDAARQNKFGNFIVDPNSIKELLSSEMRSTTPTTTRTAEEDKSPINEITLWAIIGVLVIIVILLIVVIVWQCRKKGIAGRKRPCQATRNVSGGNKAEFDESYPMYEINPDGVQPSNSNKQIKKPTETAYTPCQTGIQYDIPPSRSESCPQEDEYAQLDIGTISWEVARHDVKVGETIGEGAFGQVAKGTAENLPFHSRKSIVAVKMLKDDATESDKRDLKSELELMKTLKPHPHVIELLGCVTETEPLLVLIEYVPYGDLLGYLRKSRGLNDTYYNNPDIKPQTNLTPQQLIKFSWQIADGMSYLSSRKIIHRDLAARNVLVGETQTCKVTDFGMARSVENIYKRKTNGRLPIKWTALESLMYGEYTTESDVWSYGVVLYEIFTVGGSPYPQMDGQKIFSLLKRGSRMPKPQHVDNELYQIMTNCWKEEPKDRPSFADLTQRLKKLENQHKRLLNMHIYENTLYENLEDLNA
ncbi:uncharacterized protein [Montipora foliosa]|uniref:uncharacterized protein n=1 Tax=Montipora foliosa TaxID=591990 RepID=UPI0035F1E692